MVVWYLAIMFGHFPRRQGARFDIAEELLRDLREVGFVADVIGLRDDDAPLLSDTLDADTRIRRAHVGHRALERGRKIRRAALVAGSM